MFTLNDVAIEISIHDDSYSISHVEKPSTEYNLQTPNNNLIASMISETQELVTYGEWLFIHWSHITRGKITSLLSLSKFTSLLKLQV